MGVLTYWRTLTRRCMNGPLRGKSRVAQHEFTSQCSISRARINRNSMILKELAERVGFEPTCPLLAGKTLSRRPRYDHFGTSPRTECSKAPRQTALASLLKPFAFTT